jgi:hypothetical protein
MKRIYYILPTIALALFATVLASCSSDDEAKTTATSTPVQFYGTFNGDEPAVATTRAYDDKWEVNDAIGITCSPYFNVKYTANTSGKSTQLSYSSGKEIMYDPKINVYTFMAYYPYTENAFGDYEDLLIDMKAMRDAEHAKKYDFMYSFGIGRNGTPVSFKFDHIMTRVIFNFVDGENVKLMNNHRWYLPNAIRLRGSFETYSGLCEADAKVRPGAEDTVGNITYPNVPDTLYFFPQTTKKSTLVLFNEKDLGDEDIIVQKYTMDLALPRFEAGKSIELTISVNDQRMQLKGITIQDWNRKNQGNINASDM